MYLVREGHRFREGHRKFRNSCRKGNVTMTSDPRLVHVLAIGYTKPLKKNTACARNTYSDNGHPLWGRKLRSMVYCLTF